MMLRSCLVVRAFAALLVLGLLLGCEAQIDEEALPFPGTTEDVITGPVEDVGVVGEEVVEVVPEDLKPGATEVKCEDEAACKEIADLLPLCQEVACAGELGVCVIGLSPEGTECAMDDECSLGGACAEGVCASIGARDCSDENPCTVDTCDPLTGCVQEPMEGSEPCEDGSVCTVGDVCEGGACVAGADSLECDDENPCTEDGCDEEAACCDYTPALCEIEDVDARCDGDACADGGCFGGDPLECDDENPCTNESCNPEEGCEYSNVLNGAGCDNGDPCGAVQECQSGECIAIVETDCDDGNPCTVDGCEAGEGCYHLNSADGKPCDDGDACTEGDSCEVGLCAAGEAITCDNGVFCDGVEVCDADSGCVSGEAPDLDDGNDCTVDACDEDADEITHTADDSLCDNGLFCDGAEFCNAITGCKSGQAPAVDDFIPCTTDACDEELGEVTHIPNHDVCDNGTFCDGEEQCVVGEGCKGGTPPDVDDGIDCTLDLCDFDTDAPQHIPQNTTCDNGQFCDGVEVCDAAVGCVGGDPVEVSDSIDCTADSCDEDQDQVVHTPDHAACDNGQFCDGAEVCDVTDGCQGGEAVDVADGITCTSDSCNEDTDTVEHTANDVLCDDGDFCNGAEVCDLVDGCGSGDVPSCDDNDECTVDSCANGGCQNAEIDGCNCQPSCDGKECGGDGCGGTCGTCPGVAPVCNADQHCEAACNPACDGKECGDDGCGGTCGSCPGVAPICNADQKCEAQCFPACAGKECGDDGCGGTCGSCPGVAPICNADQKCEAECQPDCAGKQCGPNGCGGTCGGCAPGAQCSDAGECVIDCQPTCGNKECGSNGCGGICGTCPNAAPNCNASGFCEAECQPSCLPNQDCGGDGCGGSCGSCSVADAESCHLGLAGIPNAGTCVFDCGLADPGACDDGDACTDESCELDILTEISTCHYESIDGCQGCATDDECANADKCSVGTCLDGSCTYAPKLCDDTDTCETASCDPNTGDCQVQPKVCDDGDPCTDDYCDVDTGECDKAPVVCESAAPCKTAQCVDGECVDGDPKPSFGPCDDGDVCTQDNYCLNGECIASSEKNCDDEDLCTLDSCDPVTGDCSNQPLCDSDDDPCTVDGCKLVGDVVECTYEAAPCPCTVDSDCALDTEVCGDDGICIPGPCETADDCPEGQICQDGECTTMGGGDSCDAENPCPAGQVCQGNICMDEGDACDAENPCPVGQNCVDGTCQMGGIGGQDCDAENPCPEGQDCVDGTCEGGGIGGDFCMEGIMPCPDDQVCVDSACVAKCVTDADCDDDFICNADGHCIDPCVPQCAGKACDADNGCGAECGCDGDLVCENSLCVEGDNSCETDWECPGLEVCDLDTNQCVAGDDGEWGAFCMAGMMPCSEGQVCIDSACMVICSADDECPDDLICDGSSDDLDDAWCVDPCVPQCENLPCDADDSCGGNCVAEVCTDDEICVVYTIDDVDEPGVCEDDPGCTSNADCSWLENCNVETGECESAGGGGCGFMGCQNGQVCVDGECVDECTPVCNGECNIDDGCGNVCGCEDGFYCHDNICTTNVTFRVDMNCAGLGIFQNVYVSGPFADYCPDCYILDDADEDGVWEGVYDFPVGAIEYGYNTEQYQEKLTDDMRGGKQCAPDTNYTDFAYRKLEVSGPTATDDVFGTCDPCPAGGGVPGCTDQNSPNYDENAEVDSGICTYDVIFNVDMACSQLDSFESVYLTGPFIGWCGSCIPLEPGADATKWTGTHDFPLGELEYKYAVDQGDSEEDLLDDVLDGGVCAPHTDGQTFASRVHDVKAFPTSTDDTYGSCIDCNADNITCANDDACPAGHFCQQGVCVEMCFPQCQGKSCGPDGCGNYCGECADGEACTTDFCIEDLGVCVVQDKCDDDKICTNDLCTSDGGGENAPVTCEYEDIPGCHLCSDDHDCFQDQVCVDGLCEGDCELQCEGKQCGDDGCGGVCGTCNFLTHECQEGECVFKCQPSCANGQQCGDDGCGGQCGGGCDDNEECHNGLCECIPSCDGKECGSDGCGGSCGGDNPCTSDDVCQIAVCNEATFQCEFPSSCDDGDPCTSDSCHYNNNNCNNNCCNGNNNCNGNGNCCNGNNNCGGWWGNGNCCNGNNNCNGNCNNNNCNDGGYYCEHHNIDGCTVCTPECDGKACGSDDGCGGSCEDGSGCIVEGGGTTFNGEVRWIFDEYCGGCHSDAGPDPQNCSGSRCFASHYEANLMESNVCDGDTTGECTLMRIDNGSMPMGMGGAPAIVPEGDRVIIDDWILSGMPE